MQESQSRSIFYQTLKAKNHIEETRAAKNKEKFVPNKGLTYHEIE